MSAFKSGLKHRGRHINNFKSSFKHSRKRDRNKYFVTNKSQRICPPRWHVDIVIAHEAGPLSPVSHDKISTVTFEKTEMSTVELEY